MSWVLLVVIDFAPRDQHRDIARVWACENILIANEMKLVLQIDSDTAYETLISGEDQGLLSLQVKHGILNTISHRAKVCNADDLQVSFSFCQRGCDARSVSSYDSLLFTACRNNSH